MIARPPAPVLGAARGVLIWIAAMAGLLVAGAGALNTAAVAATGAQAAHGVAAPSGLRSAGGPILVFRVDVSHYPQVGVVVTVPGSLRRLKSSDFVVLNGAQASRPSVSQLSANNVQLMLVPDTGLSLARWHEEQHAAARFLVDLPEVAQTAVVDPAQPGLLAHGLTPDATSSVARLAGLPGGTPSPAARLAAALSGFSRGSRVRRTVVLVVSSPSPLAGAAAARFREQLAASGTALYVIDATSRRDPGYDALAAGSGGRARCRPPQQAAGAPHGPSSRRCTMLPAGLPDGQRQAGPHRAGESSRDWEPAVGRDSGASRATTDGESS